MIAAEGRARRFQIYGANGVCLAAANSSLVACSVAETIVHEHRLTYHAYVVEVPCDEQGDPVAFGNIGRTEEGLYIVCETIYEVLDT